MFCALATSVVAAAVAIAVMTVIAEATAATTRTTRMSPPRTKTKLSVSASQLITPTNNYDKGDKDSIKTNVVRKSNIVSNNTVVRCDSINSYPTVRSNNTFLESQDLEKQQNKRATSKRVRFDCDDMGNLRCRIFHNLHFHIIGDATNDGQSTSRNRSTIATIGLNKNKIWWRPQELMQFQCNAAENVESLRQDSQFVWALSVLYNHRNFSSDPTRAATAQKLLRYDNDANSNRSKHRDSHNHKDDARGIRNVAPLHPSVLSAVTALWCNDYDSLVLERASHMLLSRWDEARGLEPFLMRRLSDSGNQKGRFWYRPVEEHCQKIVNLAAAVVKKHEAQDDPTEHSYGHANSTATVKVEEDPCDPSSTAMTTSASTGSKGYYDDAGHFLCELSQKMSRCNVQFSRAMAKFDANQA